MTFWRGILVGVAGALGLGTLGAVAFGRPMLRAALGRVIRRLMTDRYSENLFEGYTMMQQRPPRVMVEVALRAQEGKPISRPWGTPKRFVHFDNLMFVPAQLAQLPTPDDTLVETGTIIGPQAPRPLELGMPILVSGMAYGLSLTGAAKIALARGASLAETATNSGEGGFFPEERKNARTYILQYTRGGWPSDPEILRQADAIEIQAGQGAQAGARQSTPAHKLRGPYRQALGLPEGKPAVMHSRFPGVDRPEDFAALVNRLRDVTDGIPIGIKFAAGHRLEADLQVALDAGVDFVTVDGAQAASHGGAPITEDDFGIPTLMAVARAGRFLEEAGARGRVSLIVSGGLSTPGEYLKCLALGADACAIGTAAVTAITHTQVTKVLPYEPPTELVWHDGKHTEKFDADAGARDLAGYLHSCAGEMVIGARCLGRTSLHDVTRDDLCALDEVTAAVCGLPLAWRPWDEPAPAQPRYAPPPEPHPAPPTVH